MLHNLFSVNFLSRPNSVQHPAIFFLELLILGMTYTLSGLETLRDGNSFYFLVLNYHISARDFHEKMPATAEIRLRPQRGAAL